jgi:hypothetical protein
MVTLNGRPSRLAMPTCCANCASTAVGRLPIEKVFRRDAGADDGMRYVISTAEVPFCPRCLARHRLEAATVSPLQRVVLCFRQPVILSALVMGGFAVFLGPPALDAAFSGSGLGGPIFLSIVLLFGLIAAASGFAAFQLSRRHAVVPPTSVTSAFDYTDDQSELFDRERRTYRLRNPTFADAFVDANRHSQWDPSSARATAGHRGRIVLLIVFAMATIFILIGTFFWTLP